MKYKSEDIDLLIDSLKIEEVVGEFVELKKSGANYKGLCPFHPDTTPSFMVSPSKNICKCFVCGAGGNPISFYSQYKKISFIEAVEELSKKYAIPIKSLENNNLKQQESYEKYYEIMKEAHLFYKNSIFSNQGREALEYLSNRKLNPKVIKENGFNYSIKTELGYENFPEKSYGSIVLPQGKYEAFRIIIGNGKGHNWWCVMFPPLCFVAESEAQLPQEEEEQLDEILTEDQNKLIHYEEESWSVKIKFKLIEWWQELFG